MYDQICISIEKIFLNRQKLDIFFKVYSSYMEIFAVSLPNRCYNSTEF